MKMLNRILVMVLALLVVAAPVIPQNTAQAATARATTIRLEKTEGKVGLKSQSGSNMSIKAGMKLTAGNTVSTGGASYSWESLDGSKAIKEDQNSVITLKQKGNTNEILVKKGAVAFNVKVPLKKNEKMNIRTSTMVAGVRGTIGVVEVVSDQESILYLLEGKVVLNSQNPDKRNEVIPVTVKAGQKAVVRRVAANYDENTRVAVVERSKLDEEEVPVFARTYVKGSKSMQNRIAATGKVSVPILIGTKTPCKSILPDGTVLEAASLNGSKDGASLKKQVENLVEEKIAAQAKVEEVLALTVEEILGTKTGGGEAEEPPVTPPYVPPTPAKTYRFMSGDIELTPIPLNATSVDEVKYFKYIDGTEQVAVEFGELTTEDKGNEVVTEVDVFVHFNIKNMQYNEGNYTSFTYYEPNPDTLILLNETGNYPLEIMNNVLDVDGNPTGEFWYSYNTSDSLTPEMHVITQFDTYDATNFIYNGEGNYNVIIDGKLYYRDDTELTTAFSGNNGWYIIQNDVNSYLIPSSRDKSFFAAPVAGYTGTGAATFDANISIYDENPDVAVVKGYACIIVGDLFDANADRYVYQIDDKTNTFSDGNATFSVVETADGYVVTIP